jgi:hypothetical protein
MRRGNDSLMKQELIDAAEVSGLSAYGIGYSLVTQYTIRLLISAHVISASLTMSGCTMSSPSNTRAKLGSSIKTLISRALVVKWSNPAK